jgi:2-polyprenyl-6-methoxyphenol hydroxylase-like FAD-dependent oxidoreductase
LRTDILDFFPNAGRIIHRWDNGKVGQQIHDTGCSRIRAMELCKFDGKFLTNVPWARDGEEHNITYAGHRGKVHSIFLAHAKTLVRDIRIGVAVTKYLEEDDRAGVALSSGETLWGDCVIAADGPRSIARGQVLNLDDESKDGKSSGWAVFRSFFKTDEAMLSHPGLKDLYHSDRDTVRFWMYDNLSLMAFVWNKGKDIAWVLIHPVSNYDRYLLSTAKNCRKRTIRNQMSLGQMLPKGSMWPNGWRFSQARMLKRYST